jgi:hypothetical protein
VVTTISASPGCAAVTDHDDDADGDSRTGHNVTIDTSSFTSLEDGGYFLII